MFYNIFASSISVLLNKNVLMFFAKFPVLQNLDGSIFAWLLFVVCWDADDSSDVTLAFEDAQVIQLGGYLDCLWTVSGLSLDCL